MLTAEVVKDFPVWHSVVASRLRRNFPTTSNVAKSIHKSFSWPSYTSPSATSSIAELLVNTTYSID